MKTTVPTVVQQRNVPEAVRSLSTMVSPDYVDLFTITTSERVAARRRIHRLLGG